MGAAQYLSQTQQQYLANLLSVLSKESEQVILMRRRTGKVYAILLRVAKPLRTIMSIA